MECVYVCVCLVMCDLETSTNRRSGPNLGCSARGGGGGGEEGGKNLIW